jgi:hypothetical protein
MRAGEDPGPVFDALVARGQVQLHPDDGARLRAPAAIAAVRRHGGDRVAVVADTLEQTAALNNAIRDQRVAGHHVDDVHVVTTRAGQRIGAGDRIATRRNDQALDVANRDTWTVLAIARDGGVEVAPAVVTPAGGSVTPGSAQQRVLPADYVARHVELAYASTAHGVQGDTVTTAHVVLGERTGAASAYVGMTRGRRSNIAHLVAEDLAEARKQWIAIFARDRADLGPAHAAELAGQEAARYAPPRPGEPVDRGDARPFPLEQWASMPTLPPIASEPGRGVRRPEPGPYAAPRREEGRRIRR